MGKVISVAMTFKDAFSKPSTQTIKQLKAMGKEAQATGKTIQNAGKTISKAGSSLTKSITMPIAGVAAASIKTAADFEQSMSNVKAITGASGEDFKKLEQHAKDLGASTAWSAKEVAEAMQYTGMAGWTAQENIDGLKGILDLASASGTDLASTSDIVTDAISAFGNTAKDSGMFADVMTKACTSANVSVDTLGESYKYCAALCGTMNYSVQDATTALAVMGNQGIKGSTAGTTLKNAISNLAAPTDAMKGVMDKLGISLKNNDGSMKSLDDVIKNIQGSFKGLTADQQAAYAKTLFGKQSMAGMLSIIKTSPKEYQKLSKAIKDSGGAADTAAKTQLDNLNGQITLLKSATEGAAITIGNKMLPFLKQLTSKIQSAADWFNNLSDKQVNFIMKSAGIAAAVGPVLMIFGKLVTGVGRAVSMFGKISSAIGNAGGVMALITSPAGIVIGVIAALAVAAIVVIKNWSKIKPVLQKLGTYLKSTFGPIFTQVGSVIKKSVIPVFKQIQNAINQLMPVIKTGLKSAISAVTPIVKGLIDAFKAAAPYIRTIFATAIKILGTHFKNIGSIIKAVAPIIKKVFGAAIETLVPIFQKVIKVINKTVVPIFKKVLVNVFKVASKAFKAFGAVFKVVSGIITKVVTTIAKFINKHFNTIKTVITVVMKAIITPVRVAFNVIKSVISAAVSSIGGIIDGMAKIFGGIADFIAGVFTGNWKKAWQGVKDIFSGIWETLANVVKVPINAVINLINSCISGINKACSIKVPDWVPAIGGKSFSLNIPTIPNLAHGTDDWKGGPVQIHERGGEIIDLPKGSRVYPHDESVKMAAKGGNTTINVTFNKIADTVNASNEKDVDIMVDKIANKLKLVYENM